jgi:hypothetical protein
MSLGGTYEDHHKDMFKDMLLMEKQQRGSVLEQTVMSEFMEGNKSFFDKLGAVDTYEKSSRNQVKQYADPTFERRQVQETTISFDTLIDKEDLIKYVTNPKNDITRAALARHKRDTDEVIAEAILGNAVVTTNGAAANQALTLSVAVNDHQYDPAAGSADVALTSYKLKNALQKIRTGHGVDPGERVFVVAPSAQLMNLTMEDQVVSSDYRDHKPLEGPGVFGSLSGFLGLDFIEYDPATALVDGSADSRVFMYSESAIKLGIYIPLTVEIQSENTRVANPDGLSVWQAIGATRFYEEAVCEILCDPIA